MRKVNSRTVFLSLLLLATVFLFGCETIPMPTTTQTFSGKFKCAQGGSGSPVVVFESGVGDGMESWARVVPSVQMFATTFAYSRRGYAGSTPMPTHRNGTLVVEELRELLAARGLRPPYVLVGHSLGGLYMSLYAKLYPEEVAGLVLVDATHPDHPKRLKEERPKLHALVQVMMALNRTTVMGAEYRGINQTASEWNAAGPIPGQPTIMLTATKSRPLEGKDFAEYTSGLQRELAAQWPSAEQRFVDSSHYIQKKKPEAVIRAIRDMIGQLRSFHSESTE